MFSMSERGIAEPPHTTVCTFGSRLPVSFMYVTVLIQMVGTPASTVAPSESASSQTVLASPIHRSGNSTFEPAMPMA